MRSKYTMMPKSLSTKYTCTLTDFCEYIPGIGTGIDVGKEDV